MSYLASVEEDVCSAHEVVLILPPRCLMWGEVAPVIGTGPDELLLAAAELCPTSAIRIVGQQTGEQVFP